jgi:hypothetical protein
MFGEAAFSHCTVLHSIPIPFSIEIVSKFGFSDCEELQDLTAECCSQIWIRGNFAHFVGVSGDFVTDSDESCAIRYFGNARVVTTTSDLVATSAGCFSQ